MSMCMFCAAIPATMAVGAAAGSKQRQARPAALGQGESRPRLHLPAGRVTAMVVVMLILAAAVYHTKFSG